MTSNQPALHEPRPARTAPVAAADLARLLGAEARLPETARGAVGTDGRATGEPGGRGLAELRLTGVTLDSRSVRPGDLWCALPGARAHGADFAAQAAQRGAVLALTDAAGEPSCRAAGLPALIVPDPRAATALAAALVLGRPAQTLRTVGVTGTNGKTSITTMLHRTLLDLGRASGVVGTSGTFFRDADGGEHAVRTQRTTPESPEVQGILALMVELGVQVASLEVSSHAMVLHRADEIVFDVACFTNLTQDHLDFHGDMDSYFAAKASLFTPEHARCGVVCVDDAWGRRLAAEATIPVVTYATGPGEDPADVAPGGAGPAGSHPADVRAVDLRPDGMGTRFRALRADGRAHELRSPLPGRHYVANTLAVALLLEALGIDMETSAPAIARAAVVPGRMEQVTAEPVRGIVDYSHTEDALVQALTTLRAVPGTRRVLVVMGAGGDRDRTKRPRMGAAAARLADVVVVTDDNPRSEDPAAIRAEVRAGIPADTAAEIHEVPGRAEAIALAARLAAPGDLVLVAGKGAETGQDMGTHILPFDDRVQLRAALAARPAPDAPAPQEDGS